MRLVRLLPFICLLALLLAGNTYAQDKVNWKKVKVLVYTKNGKGYVHENIPSAVSCIQRLGRENGFAVDVSDQPALFTEENLKKYTLLLFLSTNNDVFDTDEQRLAFRRYIEAGGGFVGIHSVLGTERNWKWFKMMLGGTFAWHPKFQQLSLHVIDPEHPSMQGLPKVWKKDDECYFIKEMYPGPQVLMVYDLTKLDQSEAEKIKVHSGSYPELYPAAWYHPYDGGYTWCTSLGHAKEDYSDPQFSGHLLSGIAFIAGKVKTLDYRKAYAGSRDDAVRYGR
jgi:type 1 glutamine amidotransferase